jgi:hypothetical protein
MSERITLRDGPTVAAEAIALSLELENAGHQLSERAGQLCVSRGPFLTPDLRARIVTHRADLLALIAYDAPVVP